MQILSEFKSVPWKNGQGITEEIEIYPATELFSNCSFDWRLSMATITEATTFSIFPGFDRLLTVLSGDGLKINGQSLKLTQILRFSGDEDVQCELLGSEVIDLGIIYRRDRYFCEVKAIEIFEEFDVFISSGVCFVKCLLGKTYLANKNLIGSHQFLKVMANENVSLSSVNGSLKLVIIKIQEIQN